LDLRASRLLGRMVELRLIGSAGSIRLDPRRIEPRTSLTVVACNPRTSLTATAHALEGDGFDEGASEIRAGMGKALE